MSKSNPRNTALELTLLTIIKAHVGEEGAIRREDLLTTLIKRGYELNDRQMRIAIENLRNHYPRGAWICNISNGKGYFYAASEEELMMYFRSGIRQGWSIINRVKVQAKRAIPEMAGQLDYQG